MEGAGIYGVALFEAAEQAGRLDDVSGALGEIAQALGQSPDLMRVLMNPSFPDAGKRQILARVSDGADPLVQHTLLVLADHGRLGGLPDVLDAFGERYNRVEHNLEVELTTAIAIDDAQAATLRERLERETGQSVKLVRRVDPSIVGGLVLRVRDLLIDASVRGRLQALRTSLKKARLTPAQGEIAP